MRRYIAGLLAMILVLQLAAVPVNAAEPGNAGIEYAQAQYQAAGTNASDPDDGLMMEEISCDITYQGGAFRVEGMSSTAGGFLTYAAQLNFDRAVECLYEAMLTRTVSIDVAAYSIPRANSKKLLQAVSNEHPDLYYLTKWSYYYDSNDFMTKIFPVYTSEDNFDEEAYEAGVADALSVVTEDMTELQKVIALHDYIALNCEYDMHYQDSQANPNRFNTYGVFVDHVAVCQGYALAYKYLLNRLGIECYMVTSDSMNHAWNLVGLDDEYYQVDVTWDDPTNNFVGRVCHDYLLCSDVTFRLSKGHRNWSVTYGGETLALEGGDRKYEVEPYMQTVSPMVLAEGDYYYISYDSGSKNSTIVKYDCQTGAETGSIYSFRDDIWQSSSVKTVYSGLFRASDRLWFNTSDRIYSVCLDGTELREEFRADTSEGYIYSSVLRRGEVLYQLETGPGTGVRRGNIKKADVSFTGGINKAVLSKSSVALTDGETEKLTVTVLPGYVIPKEIAWSSSDESVVSLEADISGGDAVLTARAKGSATVTVTVKDEKNRVVSASCAVTVAAKKYKVTFVGTDGSIIETQNVEEGMSAVAPAGVVCPKGYQLAGWDKDFSKVSGDMTVSALFEPAVYKITYYLEGGQNNKENPDSYDITQSIKLKEPVNGEYTFGGWYLDKYFKSAITEIPVGTTGDISLYARWRLLQQYKIAFAGNAPDAAADKAMGTLVCEYEEAYALPQNTYRRPGYAFAGWNTQADGKGLSFRDGESVSKLSKVKDGTITLYAQWKIAEYKISYGNMGDAKNDNPASYTMERGVEFADPVRTGHYFEGWYTDSGFSDDARISSLPAGSTGDKLLYAKWKPFRYTIRFLKNHSSAKGSVATAECLYGREVQLPESAFRRTGYTLSGWSTDASGSGEIYGSGERVSDLVAEDGAKLKLYAIWKPTVYAITYVNMPEEAENPNPATYDITAGVKLKQPVREGYQFMGWYSDAKYKKKVTSIVKGSYGDKKFYAKWTMIRYNVSYSANGGKGTAPAKVSGQSVLDEITLAENPYTRKGYVFKEWNTKSNGKGKVYAPGATYEKLTGTNGATVKLYAVWTPVAYTISYENISFDGESIKNSNQAAYKVTQTVKLSKPVRQGYVFQGWYKDETLTKKVTSIQKGSTGDKIFYAKWKEVRYKVAYYANGGKGNAPAKAEAGATQDIVLQDCPFRRTGYEFAGWNTKRNGKGTFYEAGRAYKHLSDKNGAVIKLYAVWKRTE